MPDGKRELSSEDLAAFDLLIAYLEESGQESMNPRQLMFNEDGPIKAPKRNYWIAATAILERVVEGVDPDEITLGQLNRDIPLAKLIEIRRSLGG
jgi:hypothetical protein